MPVDVLLRSAQLPSRAPARDAGRDAAAGAALRRIAILGHYHGGNQGDECVVAALVENLRARCPQAELLGISLNPDDTRDRHRIAAFPLRSYSLGGGARRRAPAAGSLRAGLRTRLQQVPGIRPGIRGLRRLRSALLHALREPAFLWRSYRRLRDVDLLVVAGSGPFSDDWSGPWSHPYTLFKWALLARLAGTRLAPLCVGAGPIDSPLSRALLRFVLRSSAYRSFRDPASAALIERIGVPGPHPVRPDLAFSLDLGARVDAGPRPETGPVVGLNPMAHKGYPEGDPATYEAYLEKMSDFAMRLIENGFQVRILYSQRVADPRIARELCERVARKRGGDPGDRLVHESIQSLEEMIRGILACDYVVACRYHLIILPQMLGRPVVGLAYHPKTWDLMEAMEMSAYCLDIEDFDSDALFAAFTRLRADEDRVKAVLAAKSAENRRALERQYEHLLGLAGAATR